MNHVSTQRATGNAKKVPMGQSCIAYSSEIRHEEWRMEEESIGSDRNHGEQPLDGLMKRWGLNNHDLVAISSEQLTHKQVQKARQGRQLTLKMMQKVCRALNVAIWERLSPDQKEQYFEYMHKHLFNYAKGYDPYWNDPNMDMLS